MRIGFHATYSVYERMQNHLKAVSYINLFVSRFKPAELQKAVKKQCNVRVGNYYNPKM